jgi:excisionase family DNA binding protein
MGDRLLTHEVAQLLRCTPDNVRAMARKGRFRTEMVGGIRLFSRREVEQMLAERKARPPARQPVKAGVP